MKNFLLFIFIFFGFFGITNADVINSKTQGGSWSSTTTWEGGVIPSETDQVIINGNVTIWGAVTVGDLEITGSGKLNRQGIWDKTNYVNLTITGDFINNGVLGGVGQYSTYPSGGVSHTYYYENVIINVKGKVLNNGTISKIANFNIYSDFENNGEFLENLNIRQDLEINKILNFENSIYLNGFNIGLKSGSYINKIYGKGTIYDLGINGSIQVDNTDGELNVEFEELKIGGTLSDNVNAKKILIVSPVTIWGAVTVGDLEITGSGKLNRQGISNKTDYVNLTITGDFINNGVLGGVGQYYTYPIGGVSNAYYYENVTINVKGKVLNNGTISKIANFNIYNDFENNGNFSISNTKLYWDKFGGFDDYYIEISDIDTPIEINNSNYYSISNTKLTSGEEITWNVSGKGYIENIYDSIGYRCINVPGCIILEEDLIITPPTKLKQEILSPEMDTRDIVNLGEKIGKFQSGSGVILSAEVTNNTGNKVRLAFDIYRFGSSYPTQTYYSNDGDFVTMTTGTLETIIPYLGAGEYYWKARMETDKGNTSEAKDFGTSNSWEYDYALFEGFEPYPYGYSFYNKGPADGVLDGGVVHIPLLAEIKVDGNKWDIFESAFDLTSFNSNPVKINDAFESVGLNKSDALQGGNCYGIAVSSLMQYTQSGALFLSNNHPNFSQAVGSGTIWNNINEPSTIKEDGRYRWNEYNDIIKTIYSLQVSQFSTHQRNAENLATTTDGNEILTKFNDNPDKNYVLLFGGIEEVKKQFGLITWYEYNSVGHAVVPYKVEGNKIYFWDNNYQYPGETEKYYAYNQYIEVNSDGTWTTTMYDFDEFTDLALVDINDIINNGDKSAPIGFNGNDATYTLSGSSDLYVIDSVGRISGFYSGSVLEEIPGVEVITPLNATLSGSIENTWKQIYLPQKQDLAVKVSADTEESYDLMVAGGDYYTKISGVETSSGQVDSFIPTRENLQIDFDDNKLGNYDLMINNFHDSGTGTIYMDNVESKIEPQQYIVSWTGVIDNTTEAVIYEIDTDNDGTFDESINLPPVYQDNIAPTTSYNISGELNNNTTNSYIETATIDLSAIDNDGGSGVDKIYYAIGTDTLSLVYVEYTEPVILNGVGDYTLNYYSKDLFGNIEEVKTLSFSLIERPETYAGNISGYVYDDSNENGIQDDGEKFMAGWKVCIDLNNNNDCEEQTEPFNVTNNDGYYEFDSLETGTYKILEIPHQNWIVTNTIEGSYTINLQNGQKVEQKNFGNFKFKGGK